MSPDKLISRIKAVLAGDVGHFEVQVPARRLAEQMAGLRERFEQCAMLINAGNEYAALQAAEANPPLLDTAARLSFSGLPEWVAFCRERGLDCPVALDQRHVEAVGNLYGKRIGESHPLYRDYRRAIRERDDFRAADVLMSIVRINPDDRNAQSELTRIRAKLGETRIPKLEEMLAGGDEAGAFALAESLERCRVPGQGAPVFRKIREARERLAREAAEGRVHEILAEAELFFEKEDWASAIPLLGECRAIEREFRIVFDAAVSARLDTLETWAGSRQEAAFRAAAHEEAVRAANRALADALSGAIAKNRVSLGRRVEVLRCAIAGAKRAGDGVDQSLLDDALRASAQLNARIRRKNILSAGATALVLAIPAIAGAGIYAHGVETGKSRAAMRALEAVRDAGRSDEAELFLKQNEAFIEKDTAFAEAAGALRARIGKVRAETEACSASLAGLAGALPESPARFFAHAEDFERVKKAVAGLPADAKDGLAGAIVAAEANLRKIAERLSAEGEIDFSKKTDECERLTAEGNFPEATATLAVLDAERERLKTLIGTESILRLKAVREKLAAGIARKARALGVEAALAGVNSVNAFFEAAKLTVESDPDIRNILVREEAFRNPEQVLCPALAQTLWAAAARLPAATKEFPVIKTLPSEIVAAGRISDSKTELSVWRYERKTFSAKAPETTVPLYVVGPAKTARFTAGDGYELQQKVEAVLPDGTTEPRNYRFFNSGVSALRGERLDSGALTQESRFLREFSRFCAAETGRFPESLAALSDRILGELKISPLLKAYLQQEVFKLAARRPAEHGISFSPCARKDAAELEAITGFALTLSDWLLPEKHAGLLPKLEAFYARRRTPYAEEAVAYLRVFQRMQTPGFVYVGHVGEDGKIRLVTREPLGGFLAGLTRDGRFERRPANEFKPAPVSDAAEQLPPVIMYPDKNFFAPYSPILMLKLSPEKAAGEFPSDIAPPPGGWDNFILFPQ